jgi:hypothetical protein
MGKVMSAPSARTRRIVGLTAGPVAILLAGLFVWQGSNAAFTATTRSSGNSWSTGQVALTDDDLGAAAITIQHMVPMQTGTKCIVVTSNSNVAGEVRTYFANLSPSAQGIEDHIMIVGQIGTGGTFNDCTGFVASGPSDPAASISTLAGYAYNYATGASAWTTSGTPGEKRTFRFTWTFDTSGLTQQQIDALQGGTVSVDAIWELQTP